MPGMFRIIFLAASIRQISLSCYLFYLVQLHDKSHLFLKIRHILLLCQKADHVQRHPDSGNQKRAERRKIREQLKRVLLPKALHRQNERTDADQHRCHSRTSQIHAPVAAAVKRTAATSIPMEIIDKKSAATPLFECVFSVNLYPFLCRLATFFSSLISLMIITHKQAIQTVTRHTAQRI